jgi:hypothetical protein
VANFLSGNPTKERRMIPIEAEKALKQKILSKRKQMIGMSADIHWCKIHSEVRAVLEEGYLKLGVEQLSTITGFKKESIKVWMALAQFVKDLSGRVDTCKRDRRMVNSMSILIRTDVCRLARIIGLMTKIIVKARIFNSPKKCKSSTNSP